MLFSWGVVHGFLFVWKVKGERASCTVSSMRRQRISTKQEKVVDKRLLWVLKRKAKGLTGAVGLAPLSGVDVEGSQLGAGAV